eukprot:TRINITY_DN11604_c0_g1_i2.p1 TRINITY_DN11604_c0_g1~~TRINITY_DN11604_c0_g1_i2.p1  ORF type:complete len:533 (+),score=126.17 TRINITY_DN11604_c0_g1_i2:119-1717(+)
MDDMDEDIAPAKARRKTYTIRGTDVVISAALKQGVLYHDVDKGQPCFGCDSCPGFEMHFWRKDCTKCGCAKDMHGFLQMDGKAVGKIRQPSIYKRAGGGDNDAVARRRRLAAANKALAEEETDKMEQELDELTTTLDNALAQPDPFGFAAARNGLKPVVKEDKDDKKKKKEKKKEKKEKKKEEKKEKKKEEKKKNKVSFSEDEPEAKGLAKDTPPKDDYPQASPEMLEKYSWVPDYLADPHIEEYFASFPLEKIPLRGTPGELHHMRRMRFQLPVHDVDKQQCQGLQPEHHDDFDAFLRFKIEEAGDCGWVHPVEDEVSHCYRCTGPLQKGKLCVQIERLHDDQGPAVYHHDSCFVCEKCEAPLADLMGFVYDNMLLCGRHFADMHRPRCHGCDETIFDAEYTVAQHRNWHVHHFCCRQCDAPLTATKFVIYDDEPCCLTCFNDKFADTCHACGRLIDVMDKKITDGKSHGKVWHKTCFVCAECGGNLEGLLCIPRKGQLFCKDDYERIFKRNHRGSVQVNKSKAPVWTMPQ